MGLLLGFVKKTQQTRESDLNLAVKRKSRSNDEQERYRTFLRGFPEGRGFFEETTTQAVKRVLAWPVSETIKKGGASKIEMAKRMQTSRSQVDRFHDPDNDKVLLETVQRAASAIGKRVSPTLEDNEQSP